MTTTTNDYIIEPTDNDILCGKNVKIYAKHPGNIIFQMYLTQLLDEYQKADGKREKMRMTAHVVQTMQQQHNARFLTKPNTTAQWKILSDKQARDKTSHAFRHKIKRAQNGFLFIPQTQIVTSYNELDVEMVMNSSRMTTSSSTHRIVKPEYVRPLYSFIAPAALDGLPVTFSKFIIPPQTFSPSNCSQPGSPIEYLDQIREPLPLYFKTADINSKVNFADQQDDVYDDKSLYEPIPFSNYSAFDEEDVEICEPSSSFHFKTADMNSKVNSTDQQHEIYDDKLLYHWPMKKMTKSFFFLILIIFVVYALFFYLYLALFDHPIIA